MYVVQRPGDAATYDLPATAAVVVVEEELQTIPQEKYDEAFDFVLGVEVASRTGLPIYQMLAGDIVTPTEGESVSLTTLIPLFERLRSMVADRKPDRLVCVGLDEQYETVVRDVAADLDVPVEVTESEPDGVRRRLPRYLLAVIGLVPFFADQVFSILLNRVRPLPDRAETVFFPSIGRFDSMEPVLRETDDYQVVLPTATVSWLRGRESFPDVAAHDPISINRFASVRGLFAGVKILALLGVDVATGRLERDVGEAIEAEYGFRMMHTVACVLRAYHVVPILTGLLYSILFETLVDELDPENVVTGFDNGPKSQGIWYVARERGVDAYHLPHSAAVGFARVALFGAEKIVPGQIAIDHVESTGQLPDANHRVPIGRPYLSAFYDRYEERAAERSATTEPVTITVATEPHADYVREEFVAAVEAGIEALPFETRVRVKIHPDEEAVYYRDLLDRRGTSFDVVESELYEHLLDSDLVVTISSNVGLEAMTVRTPAVCYNAWFPLAREMPYAVEGPVPVFDDEDEFVDYLASLSVEDLESLRDTQFEFVRTEYRIEADTAKDVVAYVVDGEDPNAEGQP